MFGAVAILVLIVTIFMIFYKKKYGRRDFLLKQFPSPPALPFFGHSLMFANKSPSEAFEITFGLEKTFEKIFHLSFGVLDDAFIFISDAKIIEEFLTSQVLIDKGVDYDMLKPWIGTGLLISTDKKWFQRRKVLNFCKID